jgi:hypothetical protein
MTLRLHLKTEYFNAIKSGEKPFEYRLRSIWESRIAGKPWTEIELLLGYPKKGDESRTIHRAWNGYEIKTLTHPHFGDKPVEVLAIDVTKELAKP